MSHVINKVEWYLKKAQKELKKSKKHRGIIKIEPDLNKAKETMKNLKENNIEARIYLILGLPGEPEDIEKRTWEFIKETVVEAKTTIP